MPLVSEEQYERARARLKEELARPLPFWGCEKAVLTDEEFRARVGWKEMAK